MSLQSDVLEGKESKIGEDETIEESIEELVDESFEEILSKDENEYMNEIELSMETEPLCASCFAPLDVDDRQTIAYCDQCQTTVFVHRRHV